MYSDSHYDPTAIWAVLLSDWPTNFIERMCHKEPFKITVALFCGNVDVAVGMNKYNVDVYMHNAVLCHIHVLLK